MFEFVSSANIVGASLALSSGGAVSGCVLKNLKSYINKTAPKYMITFSRDTINWALEVYADIFYLKDGYFRLVSDEHIKDKAHHYFVKTLDSELKNIIENFFAQGEE